MTFTLCGRLTTNRNTSWRGGVYRSGREASVGGGAEVGEWYGVGGRRVGSEVGGSEVGLGGEGFGGGARRWGVRRWAAGGWARRWGAGRWGSEVGVGGGGAI